MTPSEMGRKGGASKSEAKKKAARENGKKGGRPKSLNGIKTTINFHGDLKMLSYWRKWSSDDVFTCARYTRGGLVLLVDPDGQFVSVPKHNCNALISDK